MIYIQNLRSSQRQADHLEPSHDRQVRDNKHGCIVSIFDMATIAIMRTNIDFIHPSNRVLLYFFRIQIELQQIKNISTLVVQDKGKICPARNSLI